MKPKLATEESRGRERDLDGLIAMDLASGSPAAALIWAATGSAYPGAVDVRFQTRRRDHRTTDVHATAGGLALLIENKVPGGQYEPGQAESYSDERRGSSVFAITIGPRVFESYFLQKRACFDAFVAIEDVAHCLQKAAGESGLNPELRSGYLHRAHRYDALATPMTEPPIEDVVTFGNLYRELVEERTHGRVRLSPGSFQRGPRATFAYDAPVPKPLRAMHKLRHHVLDILFNGWTLEQLEDLWSTIDESERPRGWVVSAQKMGRDAKDTAAPVPVLRYPLDPVPEVTADGFAAGRAAIEDAVSALDNIGPWLRTHLPAADANTDVWLLDRLLRRAAEIAMRVDPWRGEAIAELVPK